jgi:hypothetical protein
MKYVFIALFSLVICSIVYLYKEEDKQQLALVRKLVDDPLAEIKWKETMSSYETRNYTVWRKGECSAVIAIRVDHSYYVINSNCTGE